MLSSACKMVCLMFSSKHYYSIKSIALRLEWCRTRARAHRWTEECQLLGEEMRRILAFHKWQESWWQKQIGHITDATDSEQEGLTAYALRQANIRRMMHDICVLTWHEISSLLSDSSILSSSF